METLSKSMSMRFLVVLSVSGFHFGSKIWYMVIFWKFDHFQGVFPNTSCILVFTIGTTFARDSGQQYPFMHKVQFHDKYPLFDSQSDCGFTFSYAILTDTDIIYTIYVCTAAGTNEDRTKKVCRIPWIFLALLPVLIKSFFVARFSADQTNPRPQTDSNSRMHNETLVFRVNSKSYTILGISLLGLHSLDRQFPKVLICR